MLWLFLHWFSCRTCDLPLPVTLIKMITWITWLPSVRFCWGKWTCSVSSMICVKLSKSSSWRYCQFCPSCWKRFRPICFRVSFEAQTVSSPLPKSTLYAGWRDRVGYATFTCTVCHFFGSRGIACWVDQRYHPTLIGLYREFWRFTKLWCGWNCLIL